MVLDYSRRAQGFTLIEMVIGIVVFAVALTMLTSLIYPQAQRSIDPVFQMRAAELANTLINEIQGKAYDENSNPSLGLTRCDQVVAVTPCSLLLQAEEADRNFWDDVDDYNNLTINGATLFSGSTYANDYLQFTLAVSVIYDGNYNGQDEGNDLIHRGAKLITVNVTTPNQETLQFATYRSNY